MNADTNRAALRRIRRTGWGRELALIGVLVVLLLASTATLAHDDHSGEGTITGTATMKTKGLFGWLWVKTKTCSGRPVWATPAEPWSTRVMDALYNDGRASDEEKERYERERIEVICRHDGRFRLEGLEVGRSYYVETLVRWKTPNAGIVQGGWLIKHVEVPTNEPVNVEL